MRMMLSGRVSRFSGKDGVWSSRGADSDVTAASDARQIKDDLAPISPRSCSEIGAAVVGERRFFCVAARQQEWPVVIRERSIPAMASVPRKRANTVNRIFLLVMCCLWWFVVPIIGREPGGNQEQTNWGPEWNPIQIVIPKHIILDRNIRVMYCELTSTEHLSDNGRWWKTHKTLYVNSLV